MTLGELRIDAAIAAVVFAGSLLLLAHATAPVSAGGVALTALASLPLVARRRAPVAVFVVTTIASATLRATAAPDGPPLGPTVALFSLAVAAPLPPRPTFALATAMLAVHVIGAGIGDDRFPDAEILLGTVVWSAAWLAGDRMRLRAARLAELEDRAQRAEREAESERRLAAAEERMRIARDLHDSAGHAINVILVHAGLGRLRLDDDPDAARAALQTIEDVARDTVGEIDGLVRALRAEPGGGDVEPPPGLAALEPLVERHRAAGLDATLAVRGERRPLPPAVDQSAYRIVQEALTNAARHGGGGARVEIAYGPSALELTVANPLRPGGAGSVNGAGHGLAGMRERAELLGGTLRAGAHDGRFEVRARLPA